MSIISFSFFLSIFPLFLSPLSYLFFPLPYPFPRLASSCSHTYLAAPPRLHDVSPAMLCHPYSVPPHLTTPPQPHTSWVSSGALPIPTTPHCPSLVAHIIGSLAPPDSLPHRTAPPLYRTSLTITVVVAFTKEGAED